MADLSNTYLGQYYLTEVVGRGSTSTVYKAFQSSLNRYVAVKVLASSADPQFAQRFTREAHAVAQLQHPNILPIYDYGEQGGLRYFVMQYVESSATLEHALGGGPLEPFAALRLMLPLLTALSYAHDQGVVHRDIKPANIMLPRPDWPMLADFGIAKLIDESQQLTPPGQSVGTATYMAPERATSRAVDVRTDLYSIGVVLYEMLTGRVPFEGISPAEVLRKHVREPVPPPRDLNPALPELFEPVLLRALAKHPAERYQSARELSSALEGAIGQLERQVAQRQLQQMLRQRAGAPFNPYQTLELPESQLPAAPSRARATWRLWLGLAMVLALGLGGLLMARAARGVAGQPGPAATSAAVLATSASAGAPVGTPLPTSAAPPDGAPPTPAAATQRAPIAVRFEDSQWQGGYRRAAGRTYGGRTATWIYGSSTEYSRMQVEFQLGAKQPAGTATLTIEGMDSEDRLKTPISIAVNGAEIFNGPNPLPDDDHPLESGTWASQSWSFDAALLRPGRNTISISNLAEGAFSLPPFFMLDYADLRY